MIFPEGAIVEAFRKAGFDVRPSGKQFVSPECPICGRARTGHRVSIDPVNNLWKCHGEGCSGQGNIITFCSLVGLDPRRFASGGKSMGKSAKKRFRSCTEIERLSEVLTGEVPDDVKRYLASRGISFLSVSDYVRGISANTKRGRSLLDRGFRFFVCAYDPASKTVVGGRYRRIDGGTPKSISPYGHPNRLFTEINCTAEWGVVVEGEIDFLSLFELRRFEQEKIGEDGMLCRYAFFAVPSAKYTFTPEDYDALPDNVVILLDRGAEQDAERMARGLLALCGEKDKKKRIYIASYPDDCKDLNEMLVSYGKEKAYETLVGMLESATSVQWQLLNTILPYADAFVESVVERAARLPELRFAYRTGFADLDDYLGGGFMPGLHVVAGAPGAGKTTFLLSLARRFISNGCFVLFFSLEMPKDAIITYFLSWKSGVSWMRIYQAVLSDEEIVALQEAHASLRGTLFRYLTVLDDVRSVSAIRSHILEHKNLLAVDDDERPLVVFLDYLQMMGNGYDRRIEISNAAKALAETARMYQVPIFAASSVARGAVDQARRGTRPVKEVFKESGDIEYNVHTGFLLVKQEERQSDSGYVRDQLLIVAKNRTGPEVNEDGKPIAFGFTYEVNTGRIAGFTRKDAEEDYEWEGV